jgi:excisionase family DNA binding protein
MENAILERLDRIEEQVQGNHKEQWINLRGVSKYTSLSISKIRRAVTSGELKTSKNGGRLLFKTRWVDKWLNG